MFCATVHTWLYLINGGEKSFEEERVAREELKKIYDCFISKQLVKPEHVVCANGGPSRPLQCDTVTGVSNVSYLFPSSEVRYMHALIIKRAL